MLSNLPKDKLTLKLRHFKQKMCLERKVLALESVLQVSNCKYLLVITSSNYKLVIYAQNYTECNSM